MKRLVFEGEVDDWGTDGLHAPGPLVGGEPVGRKVTEEFGYSAKNARVVLMLEAEQNLEAEGTLSAYGGFGGTDVTPGEPAEVKVGGIDIIDRLSDLDGRTVALTVEIP